ncbi:TPA: plasmid recombination protein [Streptococcus suis]
MPKLTISFKTNPRMTNIRHNNRDLTEKEWKSPEHSHILRDKSHQNIVVKQLDIRELYEKEFGPSLQEYNEKQIRNDRKIKDYYKHVGKLDTLDQQREFIIGIGSKADWDELPEGYKLNIGSYLAKYAQDFEKRHPHFRVYNAVVHLDEKGAPHLHLNVVPIADGYKNGLSKQPSFSKALKQEGFTEKGKFQLMAFRNNEIKVLETMLKEMAVERKKVGTNKIKDMREYKEMMAELEEEKGKKLNEIKAEITSEVSKVEKEFAKKKEKLNTLEKEIDRKTQSIEQYDNVIHSKQESVNKLDEKFEAKADKLELLLAQEKAINAINEQLLKDIGIKEDKNYLFTKDFKVEERGLIGKKEKFAVVPLKIFEKMLYQVNTKPMKQILDDFIDKVFNNSIVKGLKKKISQLTGELKRARVQLQHERSVRIAEQKEAEKKMDSLLKEVQPAMNLYEDFQNYLTENDKKKVFERIEKHKKLHQKQISKNRNTNDYER